MKNSEFQNRVKKGDRITVYDDILVKMNIIKLNFWDLKVHVQVLMTVMTVDVGVPLQ